MFFLISKADIESASAITYYYQDAVCPSKAQYLYKEDLDILEDKWHYGILIWTLLYPSDLVASRCVVLYELRPHTDF